MVATRGAQAAQAEDAARLDPRQGLLLGLTLVLPSELKGLRVRSVDLDPEQDVAIAAAQLAAELVDLAAPGAAQGAASEIVYRGGTRLGRRLRPAARPAQRAPRAPRSPTAACT